RDAYALRGLLEGFAATQIPPEAVPGIVSTQRALIQQMRNALDAGRFSDVAALDLEFHGPICDAAENSRLQQVWGSLSAPLQARYANEVDTLYSPAEVIARHEVLVALLEAGEPCALETGIRDHYMETARRMTAAMEAPGEIVRREMIGNDSPRGKA
ncbi:MAG: FCD domain-containing protein, partial [Thermomicrobiales bacterium]